MKKNVYAALLSFLIYSCSSSDDDKNTIIDPSFLGEIEWIKTFGGTNEDTAQGIIKTSDGGYAIIGYTNSIDGDIVDKTLQENDFWVLKLDNDGNIQWNKTYGGSGDDIGQDIIQTIDGGYAVTGYSMSADGDASNNEGFHDNWVIKLNASGDIEWEKSFGFAGHDHAYGILQTADGGYFVSGFIDVTGSNGAGNSGKSSLTAHGVGEFWANKLDVNGNLEWRRFFGGTNNDRAFGVVQANDGSFVMVGASESQDFDISNSNGSYDFWIIKVSSRGDLVWEQTFGGSGIDIAQSITKTTDNNYLVVGKANSTNGDITNNKGDSDVWVVKVSDSGKLLWERNYGGADFEDAESIINTSDGNYIITGNSRSNNSDLSENFGENDIWAIKTDDDGTILWEKSFGGSGIDLGFDAVETDEGSIIIVGETASNNNHINENKGLKDLVIIKIK
ncbi:hypothetical protein [Leptobacterium sp. I13]|uniref:hypothetical protein n=1 Tax=Leptobacterium meishanense TaxID=3128904 RepID=UPI0030EC6B6A